MLTTIFIILGYIVISIIMAVIIQLVTLSDDSETAFILGVFWPLIVLASIVTIIIVHIGAFIKYIVNKIR